MTTKLFYFLPSSTHNRIPIYHYHLLHHYLFLYKKYSHHFLSYIHYYFFHFQKFPIEFFYYLLIFLLPNYLNNHIQEALNHDPNLRNSIELIQHLKYILINIFDHCLCNWFYNYSFSIHIRLKHLKYSSNLNFIPKLISITICLIKLVLLLISFLLILFILNYKYNIIYKKVSK